MIFFSTNWRQETIHYKVQPPIQVAWLCSCKVLFDLPLSESTVDRKWIKKCRMCCRHMWNYVLVARATTLPPCSANTHENIWTRRFSRKERLNQALSSSRLDEHIEPAGGFLVFRWVAHANNHDFDLLTIIYKWYHDRKLFFSFFDKNGYIGYTVRWRISVLISKTFKIYSYLAYFLGTPALVNRFYWVTSSSREKINETGFGEENNLSRVLQ